jgi:hypothetical protein
LRETKVQGRGHSFFWKNASNKNHAHTTNSIQLAEKLESDRGIKLSPDRIRRVLKKRGSIGNEQERVTKGNKTPEQEPTSKQTSDMLELSAAAGEIDLKYLDESFFLLME